MIRDSLIERWSQDLDLLREYVNKITVPSKSGQYVCPLCGSGTGKNHTGAFGIFTGRDGFAHWKCQACGGTGTIYKLVEGIEHTTSFPETVRFVARLAGEEYMLDK